MRVHDQQGEGVIMSTQFRNVLFFPQ